MTDLGRDFDAELLQARWVLGGVDAAELSGQATLALEKGLGGTGLAQLAGSEFASRRELANLPEKAFAELGLQPIDKDQALNTLIRRGEPPTHIAIRGLIEEFPQFTPRWREHIASWGGNPAGSYNDMAEFVHFAVEDLYEKGNLEETRRLFQVLEEQLIDATQETRELIGFGFFETLQCFASWRPFGSKAFEQFLGPKSLEIWDEIHRMWEGKSNLMDVIRAEREGQ